MKRLFKNRLIVGLLALLLAVTIIFIVNPLFIEKINARVEVYEFTRDIEKGQKISEIDIRNVSIAKENDSDKLIKNKEEIIGKYAKKSMYALDRVSSVKLSDKPIKGDDYLYNIPKGKRAMSVTITSFAKGLSAKLENGDIVQIISATEDVSEIPNELRYVYLFSATSPSGIDKDEISNKEELDNKDKLPKTATLLVGEEQAKKLALLEKRESIHIALVYRGEKAEADKLLKEQDDYIKAEVEKRKLLEEENENKEDSLVSENNTKQFEENIKLEETTKEITENKENN